MKISIVLALVLICIVGFIGTPVLEAQSGQRVTRKLDRLDERLERIERRLEQRGPASTVDPGQISRAVSEAFEPLRRELLAELGQGGAAAPCAVYRHAIGGRHEVVVVVANAWLRFLEVTASEQPVTLGLEREVAEALYYQALELDDDGAVWPTVYRSVPAVQQNVPPFLLQDRLVAPALLQELGFDGFTERISLQQARTVIAALNERCAGEIQFELPTEEQLLVAAREIYKPQNDLLQPCSRVAELVSRSDFAELLGARWQLTSSRCIPFGDPTGDACPEGTFVIKGGTVRSSNALECIPEYRDALPPSVAAQDTALRLVIAQ
ncbi:MAG: hypothetical protein AAF560_27125 [Acidobacteriota bacterium]